MNHTLRGLFVSAQAALHAGRDALASRDAKRAEALVLEAATQLEAALKALGDPVAYLGQEVDQHQAAAVLEDVASMLRAGALESKGLEMGTDGRADMYGPERAHLILRVLVRPEKI